MKTKLGLLLLMLLIAVGCDDSTHLGQTAEQPQPEQPEPEQPEPEQPEPEQPEPEQPEPEQPDPVPADLPVIELPSFTNTLDMTFKEIPAGTFMMGSPETKEGRRVREIGGYSSASSFCWKRR
jgi:hypothetical protein